MNNTHRIAVLIPAHTHLEPECLHALHTLPPEVYEPRITYRASDLVFARNMLAHQALADGFGALLWIDSDMGFTFEAVEALRAHQLPIVGALYPKKAYGHGMVVSWLPGKYSVTFGVGGGLVEVLGLGCGFTMVKREVYEKIAETLEPARESLVGQDLYPYYQPFTADGVALSEDLAFCRRVTDAGFAVRADTSIRVHHIGSHAYGWEQAFARRPEVETLTVEIEVVK